MLDGDLLIDGAGSARTVVLAHGAGAPMDSPFMEDVAQGLVARGLRVVRFEFPYMRQRREGGKARPPDPQPVLCARFGSVIESLGSPQTLVIGGKSLGGRIASLIADDLGVGGLVCLGYPFHPPDRPMQLRTAHLRGLRTRALIVQGERDPFGTRHEILAFELSPAIRVRFLADGDHSFAPRVRSGRTRRQNLDEAIAAVADFVEEPDRAA